MKKILLSEMSWSEFAEAMIVDDVIVFPVGSIEQHGPHNPLGTDYILAGAAAKAIGEKANAVVGPCYPLGNAINLMGFPGTASIDVNLLKELLVQSCECLAKHGAKRFLFINGHGGNVSALDIACTELYEKHKILALHTEWWLTLRQLSDEFPCNDHGGKFETSMNLAVCENLVDMSKAVTVPKRGFTEKMQFEGGALKFKGTDVRLGMTLDEVSDTGNYGARAEEADKKMGLRMFDMYVDYCAGLVEELRKVTL